MNASYTRVVCAHVLGSVQEPDAVLRWTYVWLALVGLLLVLAILAFAYLLVRRRWAWIGRLLDHPALGAVERQLAARVPRLWGFMRRRFSVDQWRGLALTAGATVLFAAVYAFAVVTESWADQETLYELDRRVYDWLTGTLPPGVVGAMRAITRLGDTITIAAVGLLTAAYLLYRGYQWRLVELVVAVGGGSAVMWGLKWIFGRSRPGDGLADAMGQSFPSGHAFSAVVLYGYLIYLTWRMVRNDAIRVGVTVVLAVLVVLIGLSRVILRVHWVSDVAGGLTSGLAWLVGSIVVTRAIRAYRRPSGPESA